jgi:serine protease Do
MSRSREARRLARALAVALPLVAPAAIGAEPEVARRNAIVQAVEAVGPAVVNIATEQRVRNPFAESLFGRSFAELFGLPEGDQIANALGSGTIVDPRGYILTNDHVLWGASRITVGLADGRKFEAEVVGTDAGSDLAVIRIHSDEPLPATAMGSSADAMIGETVIAIGNPLGLGNTVTVGVLSARGREVQGGNRVYADFLQTDAPINPGNSGGPLLNVLGQLIGINTSIAAGAEGIGFAIPIDRARVVLDELLSYGRVRDVWLGMDVLGSGGGRAFDAAASKVVVVRSYVGGPADRAGVRPGDVVLEVDGSAIRTVADWNTSIRSAHVGSRLELTLERGGERVRARVAAETFPFALAPTIAAELVGVEVADITEAMRRETPLPGQGVVVTGVRPGSPAARLGMRPGDVITRVNAARVDDMNEFAQAVPRMLEFPSVQMIVVRRGVQYRVTVDLA